MSKNRNVLTRIFTLFFAISVISQLAIAQIDTSGLTGQVKDAQDAAISGARVKITNQQNNISFETITNADGYFTFTGLRPSKYLVEVSQNGFGTQSRKDVELNVGQKVRYDFVLAVGSTAVSVDVTTENQSILQRENASLGNRYR